MDPALDAYLQQVAAARPLHPALVCPAAGGLELSLVTAAAAADPAAADRFAAMVLDRFAEAGR